jgi:polysaccharide deacetylase 2 family uncharacterized protein YibQ
MRRQKRKKTPRKTLITAVTCGLIALIIIATGLVLFIQRPSRPTEGIPAQEMPVTITRPLIMGEELLIKGCLYELGVPKEKVSIKGRTVRVTMVRVPSEASILKAFSALEQEDGVKVGMEDSSRLIITMNGHSWVVVFSAAKAQVETRARVAIIVDDMGQDMGIARKLAAIDADLTFAVLPHGQYSSDVARYLHKAGRQVLLHLPMEGNGKNPGPGAIYGTTAPDEAARILREALELVPLAQGVNNHMGSVATQNRAIMDALFSVLKERDIFFVDSLTTGNSVCRAAAEEIGLPFEARDVFLDNEQTTEYISGQIDDLVEAALSHGEAIGICHPHQATYRTLAREVPRLRDMGIEVVKVSELIDEPGM